MNNKLIFLFMTITLLMVLTACQEKTDSSATSVPLENVTASTSSDDVSTEASFEELSETSSGESSETTSEESSETSSGESSEIISGQPAEVEDARLAEYRFALQQIAFEHIYPDGTETGFDSTYGSIEDNRFAVYDVDGDGVDELIVQFTTAPMAGNTETIYTYHKADGTLKNILTGSPNLIYYSNGIIKENWSHGSALAGEDYWPYTLYQYNAAEESFEQIAQVEMWSKAMGTVDYKGDSYPEDIDAEGVGTVFILTRQGEVDTISKTDYEKWLSDTMGSATELEIPYQALTEENIGALN